MNKVFHNLMFIVFVCLFCFVMVCRCLADEHDTFETLVKEIKAVELLPFEKIVEDGMEFEYRVYKKPVSLSFSRTVDIPINHNISPLYSSAVLLSLIESKKLTDEERFNIFFDLFEAKESVWISLRELLKTCFFVIFLL